MHAKKGLLHPPTIRKKEGKQTPLDQLIGPSSSMLLVYPASRGALSDSSGIASSHSFFARCIRSSPEWNERYICTPYAPSSQQCSRPYFLHLHLPCLLQICGIRHFPLPCCSPSRAFHARSNHCGAVIVTHRVPNLDAKAWVVCEPRKVARTYSSACLLY